MRLSQLYQRLRELGARPAHEQRILQSWIQQRPLDRRHSKAEDFLPLPLRQALPDLFAKLDGLACLVSRHSAEDGAERLLVQLVDGQTVETVLLPREGLCVSTQVGCAVGCTFCMTGRSGLIRQLSSGEIVAQVVLARRIRPVKKVVFMGMGEPAHNLDNVLEAIELLGTHGGIGHKNLVFSTVGDARVFERLPQGRVKPALAISLHSTHAERRAQLLPKAPRLPLETLVALGEEYAQTTGHPVMYQWTVLEGINDGEDEIEGIVRLLSGKRALINLIPYNTTEGLPYQRPSPERLTAMAHALHARGIYVTVRYSAGQSVDGGCGQLRARMMRHIPRVV